MAVTAGSASVTTTATLIATNSTADGVGDDWKATGVLLKNFTATATVYLGGSSSVTTGNGFPWVAADPAISVTLEPGESVYGIVATTTQTVNTLTVGR